MRGDDGSEGVLRNLSRRPYRLLFFSPPACVWSRTCLVVVQQSMVLTTAPLPYPSSASPALARDGFGIVVNGVNPNELSEADLLE